MYDDYGDDEERGRGRVFGLVAVVAIAACGWFFARPALSNDDAGAGRGGTGELVFDPATTSTTSTSTTTVTTRDVTTARVVTSPSVSSTTSTAPTSTTTTAPPPTTVVITEPPVPVATLPDGSPAPVEIHADSSQIVLTGAVPSQQAVDVLVTLAEGLRLTPVTIVNDLTINPAVPDSVSVRVVERNAIVFNEGSDTIHETHARQLDRFVEILTAFPQTSVHITAHADQRNDAERNQAISDERAQSVAAYFTSRGIDPARVTAAGSGESEPLLFAETDDAYAVNRRVDFLFTGLLSA